MTGKGRRGTRTRNHAVKDKAMDRDFLVEDEDDDMNLSNIKEKGRSGRFTSKCHRMIIIVLVEYEDDYSNEE